MSHYAVDTSRTRDLNDALREVLADDETANEYLKDTFLASVTLGLVRARKAAGLTQSELASRLNTTQSSIARLENDLTGSATFRRYIDYCLALGTMPLDPELVPTDELRKFALEDPDSPPTASAYTAWQHHGDIGRKVFEGEVRAAESRRSPELHDHTADPWGRRPD